MKRLKAFFLGMKEFRLSTTWADPAREPEGDLTELDVAYDYGRMFAHRITFGSYDETGQS